MSLRDWSITASGNSSVAGINFAEGQAANTLNNSNREAMAQLRQQYDPDQWIWVGVPDSASLSIASQTQLKFTGNLVSDFEPYRRFRLTGGSTTVEGYITSSSFTGGTTTVKLTKDSGSLSTSHTVIELSAIYGDSIPYNVPRTDAANTITGNQTIVGDLTLVSSVSGAGAGPVLTLSRLSDTPADGDLAGAVDFLSNNSAGSSTTFARLVVTATDQSNGTEDATLSLRTITAGVFSTVMNWAAGIWTQNATGGDKGVDTINAVGFYVNGVPLPTPVIKSTNQDLTTTTALQVDDELLFPMAASTRYRFTFLVSYITTAAADFKFDIDSAATADPIAANIAVSYTAPDGTTGSAMHAALNQTVSITAVSGTEGFIRVDGYVQNDTDAGNLRFRWAQVASSGTTTVRRSSYLEYRVV